MSVVHLIDRVLLDLILSYSHRDLSPLLLPRSMSPVLPNVDISLLLRSWPVSTVSRVPTFTCASGLTSHPTKMGILLTKVMRR